MANARLAYADHQEAFTGDRWADLLARGARDQRPLWASTGTKNLDYPDTVYVTELVVANSVNTMPEKTLRAFAVAGVFFGAGDDGASTGDTVVIEVLEHDPIRATRNPRACGHCGESFTAKRSDAKYCSPKCRVGGRRARLR